MDDLCVTGFALPEAFQPLKDKNEDKLLHAEYKMGLDLDHEMVSDLDWSNEEVQDIVTQFIENDLSWYINLK